MIKTLKEKIGDRILEYEYDTDWIKENCVICGKFITNTIQNYEVRGNYCSECNGKYKARGRIVNNEAHGNYYKELLQRIAKSDKAYQEYDEDRKTTRKWSGL